MATGSFILKGSRRKVGSIVTYSRGGKQVVRALASSVSNPKTVAQSLRRAFFAPAAKFYSPLATILETSWQGQSKSASYSAYLKKAIEALANNGIYIPKGTGFMPIPVQVSKGTIQPLPYEYDTYSIRSGITVTGMDIGADSPNTIGELSALFIAAGYSAGMQVTIILALGNESPTDSQIQDYWPATTRFLINPSDTRLISDVFNQSIKIEAGFGDDLSFTSPNFYVAGGAVIISNYENDMWRRSTQYFKVSGNIVDELQSTMAYNECLASYMNTQSTVQSNVYLNAGGRADNTVDSTFTLSDGSVVTLQSISFENGVALVRAARSSSVYQDVNVKIGADYLLSANTKGALPAGATATTNYLDGTNTAVQQWLQENGVAASVFQ